MSILTQWLEGIGLGRYGSQFESNGLGLRELATSTEAELAALGLSFGERQILLRAVASLLPPLPARATGGTATANGGRLIESATADGERRQVTVLFCDLVGSVALSSRYDPEDLRDIMSRYHVAVSASVRRFDGYVAQIQGDAVVAYFGYPIAHEAEADRAVRAGLAIVASLDGAERRCPVEMQVRIGIASGLVVVSHLLSPEKSAVGEAPNLAQRLHTAAAPMEVVISDRTRALAGGAFDYADRGFAALKGIEQPVRVWRVVGASDAANRFDAATRGGLTPLVGREREIDAMSATWAAVERGDGQVVLLSGEPGIGKSRTLRALRHVLGDRVRTVLQFQCSPYYQNSALHPIVDHLERGLRTSDEHISGSRLDRLHGRIGSDLSLSARDCRLIAELLSIPCDGRFPPLGLTPQRQKDETLRALSNWIAAHAGRAPTLVVFEDVHWSDASSLELLNHVVERAAGLPLLVAITFRPEFDSPWSDRTHVAHFGLERLGRADSAALILRVAGGRALPDDLVDQIVEKTDGVPLFLEELTKAVLESALVVERAGRYEYSRTVDRMAVPATLRDSLMARLDRLIPVKEIAQIGSVIGREFGRGLLAAVAAMADDELEDALARLVDSGLVFRRGDSQSAVYTFKHALVQDAAYDSLLKTKRQALHARIARIVGAGPDGNVPPELIAHHYTAAGLIEQAIPHWRAAGEAALRRVALPEAIAHFETGLALNATLSPGEQRDRVELAMRSQLGAAFVAYRGWPAPQVASTLEPAFELAKSSSEPRALISVLCGIWVNCLTQGRIAESMAWVRESFLAAERIQDDLLTMMAHMIAVVSHFWLGNFAEAQAHGDHIRAAYDPERHREIVVLTNHDPLTSVGIYASHYLWMLGYPDRAAAESDAKDAQARRIGHPYNLGFALTTGAHAFDYRGEPGMLLARAIEAEALGRETGLPFVSEVLAQLMRGVSLLRAGAAAAAEAQLRSSFAVWEGSGAGIWSPYLRALLGESIALQGRADEALSLVDRSLRQTEKPGWEERSHLAEILRLRGWMLHLKEVDAAAELDMRAGLDVAVRQRAKSWELRCACSLAALLQRRGRTADARAALVPVLEGFTEGFDTADLRHARTVAAGLNC